jgi:RNA polymerase sigma-70 factor (ECF subfamily)
MYRAAAAIVGRDEAEDVTQDALLDAWRGFGKLRDRTRVRPWLHSIVANRSRKYLRGARSRPRLIEMPAHMDLTVPTASDPANEIAERDRLDRGFHWLSADQRICLALRYSLDWSVPDIADALRIAEGTVKSRIHAGMARLRATVGEDDS